LFAGMPEREIISNFREKSSKNTHVAGTPW
jgi:hypothetical protein